MDFLVVLPALAGLALLFVLIPVAVSVFLRYQAPRLLRCPVTERDAAVQIDARLAALGALAGVRCLWLQDCSLWRVDSPGCYRECLANVDDAEVAPASIDRRLRSCEMASLARLAVVLMAVLAFVFSGGDSSRTDSAAHTAIPEPSAMADGLRSPSFSTPVRDKSLPSREVSEEKMLAWILLLLKQGAGAR